METEAESVGGRRQAVKNKKQEEEAGKAYEHEMMASYQDAGGDKIAAPQGQRSRGGHDTINRGQGMTQVIRFKDRKQTLSNEHGHYRFVSGDTILVMIIDLQGLVA